MYHFVILFSGSLFIKALLLDATFYDMVFLLHSYAVYFEAIECFHSFIHSFNHLTNSAITRLNAFSAKVAHFGEKKHNLKLPRKPLGFAYILTGAHMAPKTLPAYGGDMSPWGDAAPLRRGKE